MVWAINLTGKSAPNTGIQSSKLGAEQVAMAKAREDFKAGISRRLAVLEQATNALRVSLEINCGQQQTEAPDWQVRWEGFGFAPKAHWLAERTRGRYFRLEIS